VWAIRGRVFSGVGWAGQCGWGSYRWDGEELRGAADFFLALAVVALKFAVRHSEGAPINEGKESVSIRN